MNAHTVSSLEFLAPANAWYIIFLIPTLLLLGYKTYRMLALIRYLQKAPPGSLFLHNISPWRSMVKSVVWGSALIMLYCMLLHPAWTQTEQTIVQHARDLFIALDVSASMRAQDVSPNRLACAKTIIATIAQSLASDRIGLILFSGTSFVQCPLTRDMAAFCLFLNQVDTQTIASGSTHIETAIAKALTAFKEAGTQNNKLLIIITDGEDFSTDLAKLRQEAEQAGLLICTIGIGTAQGAPIPLIDQEGKENGHIKDTKNTIVISRLDHTLLQSLAHALGGIYLEAQSDSVDLQPLYKAIEKIEKQKCSQLTDVHAQEQYHYAAAIALLLLLLEWIL